MGSLERRIKRFEEEADLDYIPLKDGSRFWFNKNELYKAFFLYYLTCLHSDYEGSERPPVPDIFLAVAGAKDRRRAMDRVCPGWEDWRSDHTVSTAIDLDKLVKDGRIEPYNTVALVMASATDEELEEYEQFRREKAEEVEGG